MATEDQIQDNSEITQTNVNSKKYLIVAIAIFGLLLGGTALFSIFGKNQTDEPVAKESTSQATRDIMNKTVHAQAKENNTDIITAIKEDTVISNSDETEVVTNNRPISIKPSVYKSSSLLISSDKSRNSGSGNSDSSGSNNGVLDMNDPCVVYDETQNKFRKLDPQECQARTEQGITSKYYSKKEVQNDPYDVGVYKASIAQKNNFNPSLTLPEGTFIPCSLNTKVVTQIAGQISCTVTNNIYSSNGQVLLIEKGSKVSGSFKSGELNDGMNRIFVVWNNVRTPENIDIPVNSGASDTLGGTGLEGWVDHHYFTRFGTAILVSVIDDAMGALVDRYIRKPNVNAESNYDATANTRETAKEIAKSVLDQFKNIKPTLYRNHGDLVGIYVNRDIDFSNVYSLEWR